MTIPYSPAVKACKNRTLVPVSAQATKLFRKTDICYKRPSQKWLAPSRATHPSRPRLLTLHLAVSPPDSEAREKHLQIIVTSTSSQQLPPRMPSVQSPRAQFSPPHPPPPMPEGGIGPIVLRDRIGRRVCRDHEPSSIHSCMRNRVWGGHVD
jgi:hypothetical protein